MGKVVPVPTVARFLEILKLSRLLSSEAWSKVEQQNKEGTDPALLARNLVRDNLLTKWQAGQLLHGYHALVVGKYKLLEQVSINETGRVYLAEHGQLGRKVALKLLAKQYMSNPEIVARFLSEARVAAAIDHRNILHVHDVAQEADRTFLVTEYVAGQCLNELVKAGPVSLERIVAIMQQLANGMGTAHEKNVVHGGLRPSTVLLDSQGTVKIIDLGVASLADLTGTAQEESTELSTDVLAFAAPERADKTVVAAGDIYALGGILFFLLTGESPKLSWKTRDPAKSAATVGEIFALLKAKCGLFPVQLLKLCALCLAPLAKDRPKSMADITKALDAIVGVNGKPTAAADAGGKVPLAKALVETINIAANATPSAELPAAKAVPKSASPNAKPLPKAKVLAAVEERPTVTGTARVATAKTATAPKKQLPAAKIAAPVVEDSAELMMADEVAEIPLEAVEEEGDFPDLKVEPTSGFGGISIQTGPSAAPTKGPAAAAFVTTGAASATPAVATANSKLPLILGLSIGGGVLALLGIVAIVFMMSGSTPKPKEVARSTKGTETAEKATTESTDKEPEPDPEPEPETEKAPPKKSILDNAPPTTETKPETTPETKPTPETPETPPTEPTPTPTPEPASEPAPKPEPAPPAKPSLDKPFRELPKVALLPPLGTKGNVPEEALQEKVFGKMYLAGADCFLELHGGEGAAKGKKEFVMKSANNETSTTDYEIRLKSGSDSASAPVIAKITVGEAFKFQWQPAALETVDAPYLMNCELVMNVGKFTHEVRFREIQTVDPLLVNAPPKPVSAKWNSEFLPDASRLKIEFIGVEGIDKHKFDKKEIACLSDTTTIWIGKMTTPLGIKVTPTAARSLEIKGQFVIKTEGDEKEQPFKAKLVEQMLAGADGQTQAIERQLAQLTSVPQPADRKKQIEQQADIERQKVAKYRNEWQGVGDAIAILKAPAAVHFRLIFETKEGRRIEIFTSKPGNPPGNTPKA